MELILEIFEQGHRRAVVRHFNQSRVRVGRGWDCDLVIRDPYVDAQHLDISIDEMGQVHVTDLGSLNGVEQNHQSLQGCCPIETGKPIRFGHSHLVVHRATDTVVPAMPVSRIDMALDVLRQPWVALALLAAAVALSLFNDWVAETQEFDWPQQLVTYSQFTMLAVLWSVFWGLIARVVRHQLAIVGHLSLIAIGVLLYYISSFAVEIFAFNALSFNTLLYGDILIWTCLAFIWVWLGLELTARLRLRNELLIAAATTLVFVGVVYLLPLLAERDDELAVPLFTMTRSPDFYFAPATDKDLFVDRAVADLVQDLATKRMEILEEQDRLPE